MKWNFTNTDSLIEYMAYGHGIRWVQGEGTFGISPEHPDWLPIVHEIGDDLISEYGHIGVAMMYTKDQPRIHTVVLHPSAFVAAALEHLFNPDHVLDRGDFLEVPVQIEARQITVKTMTDETLTRISGTGFRVGPAILDRNNKRLLGAQGEIM